MNLDLTQLRKIYKVKAELYVSQFYANGGKEWLYNSLKSLYQPEYDNDQRIVVIQDCGDQHSYDDLPGLFVTELQKNLSTVDISNFFVLFITTNQNIADELESARKLYSTDSVPISHIIVDGIDNNYSEQQDTFCVLPWMHLYVGPNGDVLPCCVANQTFPMGNIEKHSISDIINSKSFVNLRTNMLAGKKSKECAYCYKREESGLKSPRVGSNQTWNQIKVGKNTPIRINNFKPIYIDIRLSNVCNLKCRYCSDYFSSSIAQEKQEMFGISNKIYFNNQKRKQALGEILEYLPVVEKIYFAGGEPMLAPEHYAILQKLIEIGNTNLEIVYNTNFTTLKFKDINVVDLWKKFPNVVVGASLDGHNDVIEYVRHGTNWKSIEENLLLVKQQTPHVKIQVTSVVSLMNIESLIDLQKDWHEKKFLNLSNFIVSPITTPEFITVRVLPNHHKHRCQQLILDHISWCKHQCQEKLAEQWQSVLNFMWSSDDSFLLEQFQRNTQMLDQHRNESFVDVFPQYQDLMSLKIK